MIFDPELAAFVTARRLALQSQCRPAPHWQCPKCDARYASVGCPVCDAIVEAMAVRAKETSVSLPTAPVEETRGDGLPPPSGWRERPGML